VGLRAPGAAWDGTAIARELPVAESAPKLLTEVAKSQAPTVIKKTGVVFDDSWLVLLWLVRENQSGAGKVGGELAADTRVLGFFSAHMRSIAVNPG